MSSTSPLNNFGTVDWNYTTFGPYAAANFAGPVGIALPFRAGEPVVVGGVTVTVGTVCSVSSTKLIVKTRLPGVTVATAADVADTNTLASANVNSITVDTPTAATLTAGNAFLEANEGLVASTQVTDGTIAVGTALADAYITLKWRPAQPASRNTL